MIEAEIAGAPRPDAGEGARGFVGIAFRVQDDLKTYDAFYLRPTNGRRTIRCAATTRRSTSRTRIGRGSGCARSLPEKYEAYVDLVAGEWTKVRIEVRGAQAQAVLHGQAQPT